MIAVRTCLAAASLALCAAGLGSLTAGLAVPMQARTAQAGLERAFERKLAAALLRPAAGHHRHRKAALPQAGAVARLAVPRLGIHEIVAAGSGTPEELANAPTMIRRADAGTPVTILAAHRDTHFAFIRDLRPGDTIELQLVTGERQRYRITRLETIRREAFAYPLNPARPLLVLSTCYPFDSTEYGGPLRRIVWAVRS